MYLVSMNQSCEIHGNRGTALQMQGHIVQDFIYSGGESKPMHVGYLHWTKECNSEAVAASPS